MSGLADVLAAVSAAAGFAGVRWYVFGAQAVAVHGVPRATQDLDVTVLADPAELGRFRAELARRGLEPRYPEIAEELLRTGAVVPLVHALTGYDLDVVVAGTEIEVLAADRAVSVFLAGVLVPVCSATDLAIAKAIAGRPLDMSDLRGLVASGRVDCAEVRAVLRAVERAVGEDGMVAAFDAEVSAVR